MQNKKLIPYIMVAPVFILVATIMFFGITNCVLQSLGYFPRIGMTDITFEHYTDIISDTSFISSFWLSLKTSFVSAMLSVLIGIIAAYIMTFSKYTRIRKFIVGIPVAVPHIIAIVLMIFVFSKTGIISRLMYSVGAIKDSSDFYNILFGENGLGIIIVYMWKGVPYVMMTVYGILKSVSEKYENAAMNLGASRLQVFRYIVMPQAMPFVVSSFIILFSFSFGSYEVPMLIGPSTPQALPVYAYVNYISADFSKRSVAMAANMIISIIGFVMLYIYSRVFEKIDRGDI